MYEREHEEQKLIERKWRQGIQEQETDDNDTQQCESPILSATLHAAPNGVLQVAQGSESRDMRNERCDGDRVLREKDSTRRGDAWPVYGRLESVLEGVGVNGGPWRREARASEGEADERGEREGKVSRSMARSELVRDRRDDMTDMASQPCDARVQTKTERIENRQFWGQNLRDPYSGGSRFPWRKVYAVTTGLHAVRRRWGFEDGGTGSTSCKCW
ncbi:hypothetical protein EDB83DRAFT_2319186 [Lactarius deliciosus]|nr:hypothetical protein EDB83DRAFT_2319186 [Lactarius deliciosus]